MPNYPVGVAEGALIILVLDRFVTFAKALLANRNGNKTQHPPTTQANGVVGAKLDEVIRLGVRQVDLLEAIRGNGSRCPYVPNVTVGKGKR